MKIKLQVTSCNEKHCRVTVFIEGQNAGNLVFRPNEWLLFSVAQMLAQDTMKMHYELEINDDKYTPFCRERDENEV